MCFRMSEIQITSTNILEKMGNYASRCIILAQLFEFEYFTRASQDGGPRWLNMTMFL